MLTIAAVVLVTMGVLIAVVWTHDIVSGDAVDLTPGFFHAREPGSGSFLWPHWLAEYSTAALLVAGGAGLLGGASWSRGVAFFAAGALLYTSVSSLGWALAKPERRAYAAPMVAGAAAAVYAFTALLEEGAAG
jgi:hypothetical protein